MKTNPFIIQLVGFRDDLDSHPTMVNQNKPRSEVLHKSNIASRQSTFTHSQLSSTRNLNKLFYSLCYDCFPLWLLLMMMLLSCFLQLSECYSSKPKSSDCDDINRIAQSTNSTILFNLYYRNVTTNDDEVLVKRKVPKYLLNIDHSHNNSSINYLAESNQPTRRNLNSGAAINNNNNNNNVTQNTIQSSNNKKLRLFSIINSKGQSVNNLRNAHLRRHRKFGNFRQENNEITILNFKTTKRKLMSSSYETTMNKSNYIDRSLLDLPFPVSFPKVLQFDQVTELRNPNKTTNNNNNDNSNIINLRHNHNNKRQKESRRLKRQKQVIKDIETETESIRSDKSNEMIYNWIKNLECRTEWGFKMSYFHYRLDTCARCYHYMPETAFKPGHKFSYVQFGMLTHSEFNVTLLSTDTERLSLTFITTALVLKWQQCCADSVLCCLNYHNKYHHWIQTKSSNQNGDDDKLLKYSVRDEPIAAASMLRQMDLSKIITESSNENTGGRLGHGMCPPTWDGWLCWDEFARPNQVLERPCPKHIYWHHLEPPCGGYVTKRCNSSGRWYVNQDNKEWSNYTMCARDDIYARRVQYSLVTNIISMCALIPALLIFSHYKQLASMARIRLHKHLFTSLLFHSIIAALLKWHLLQSTFSKSSRAESPSAFNHEAPVSTFSDSTDGSSFPRMPSLCLVLSVLLRYFRSTNYLWMFNEALYLHQLIKHAFSQPSLRPLIILAYILPFITTTAYIFARSFSVSSDLATVHESLNSSMFNFTTMGSNPNNDLYQSSPAHELSFNDELVLSKITEYNKLVDNVRTSFIQLPEFQKQFREASEQHTKNRRRSAIKLSSLNDLLHHNQDQFSVNRVAVTEAAPSPVPMSVDHKSSFLPSSDSYSGPVDPVSGDDAEQHVLENLEALEDITPLTDNCWLMPSFESWHEWIINVPNFTILIINCFFLVWLLRILCIKAAATMGTNSTPSHGYGTATNGNDPNSAAQPAQSRYLNGSHRRSISSRHHHSSHHHGGVFNRQSILVSLRAAVLLLPLYGLHYLFIVYRPKIENCWISEMYHYLSLSLDGLQGLAISIIFCFANSEIRHLLTRTLQRVGTRQRSTTIYMTEVAATNRD